jgi:hypothetical protein
LDGGTGFTTAGLRDSDSVSYVSLTQQPMILKLAIDRKQNAIEQNKLEARARRPAAVCGELILIPVRIQAKSTHNR